MATSTVPIAPRMASLGPAATPLSCAELVRQAQGGDRAAFEVLVHRHFDSVYAAAHARLDQREAAEDLAQEVFLRAWLNLRTLNKPESFEAWVMRMARHLSISWRRNSRRRSELVPMVTRSAHAGDDAQAAEEDPVTKAPDHASNPRDAAADAEERERLRAALAKLPAADRELVIRHFLDEHSQRDIARDTGEHHTTIGRRLATAMGRLRSLVGAKPVASPAALLVPRPEAVGRTCAVIAAVALMPPAAQAAVQAKAAASSATLLGSLFSSAALAAEGILAMGAASKLTIAATAAALMIGGGTYVYQTSGGSMANAAVAAAAVTPTRVEPVVLGRDFIATVRPGDVLRIDMRTMGGGPEIDFTDLYVDAKGRLMLRSIKPGGEWEEEALYPLPPDSQANFSIFQVWPDRNLCLVASINGRPAPDGNGFEVAFFANSRPELIDQAASFSKQYFEGKIPKREARLRTIDFFAANNMLPADERNRAQLLTLMQREW